ncbi:MULTISPECIES: TadA family conjugal transfer-associated ATPase [unclassified Microbacterium]|uniref:TadA family conjugal transfer-associated ATPase n=1 Tax=unclassified Microbacterium TaxID=2609290 RepID=UPI001604C3AE|nr:MULTISPECIES: TadA family conjugal transfer-associated ATPase [unclassified Microbacterium]QNA93315.1 TadA family conjugal transfer-associated ATPase [Microbacterium sp. Se63.02b]QYM63530.1 TadA family conjugal transfer-associated ATPase [Microbacterium sp. Se5.02b]
MTDSFVIQPREDSRVALSTDAACEPLRLDHAFGPLRAHIDETVTDVFVNGTCGLFVDRGHGAEAVAGWRASEREVRELAVALVGLGGRHLDDQAPCVDVRLNSGIRVHAVLAPVATAGTALSIRIPRVRAADLDALAALGAFGARQQAWLLDLVAKRANILITGGTGTGKTTLLSALLSAVPPTERIVTIEDVAELRPRHPHHVALEARQANLEGAGGISLSRLVRESLRMRPDRLVVGECRGEEVRELLTALNTGHDGGAGTLHASGLRDVPARLEALGALAGMDAVALARQCVSAFTVVLHLDRAPGGVRRIRNAGRLVITGDRLDIQEVSPW